MSSKVENELIKNKQALIK